MWGTRHGAVFIRFLNVKYGYGWRAGDKESNRGGGIQGTHQGINIWMFPKIVGFPPKSSILIGFSIINHPFWGTPIFGNTHI